MYVYVCMYIKNKGYKNDYSTTLMLTNFELLQVFVRYNVFTGNKQSKSVLSFYKSILLFTSFCYFSNCNLNWNRKIN